jgi:hypothetical protein
MDAMPSAMTVTIKMAYISLAVGECGFFHPAPRGLASGWMWCQTDQHFAVAAVELKDIDKWAPFPRSLIN